VAALTRAARVGNGWFGWLTAVDQTRGLTQHLNELADAEHRPAALGPIEMTVAAPGAVTLDLVEAYRRIGVSRLVVGPDSSDGDNPDRFIETFQHEILAHQ
jgi:hypothetical protein